MLAVMNVQELSNSLHLLRVEEFMQKMPSFLQITLKDIYFQGKGRVKRGIVRQ